MNEFPQAVRAMYQKAILTDVYSAEAWREIGVTVREIERALRESARLGLWDENRVKMLLHGLVRQERERCARRVAGAAERFPDNPQIQAVLRGEAEDLLEGV